MRKSAPGKSVVKEKSKKSEDEFPGYPHYPAKNDIMNPKNGMAKKELIETSRKLVKPSTSGANRKSQEEKMEKPVMPLEEEESFEKDDNIESEISKEEKFLLESDQLSEDMGEDDELRTRVWPLDMAGEDLDVPGTELDDSAEDAGEEDEENNPYSIGGDRHEDMEQEHDPGR